MADCATRLRVKLCLLRLCFFSGFIFGSIHRNLVKHEFGANSYAAYSLKCWAVWGFLGAWGEEQQCFGSHTQSPSPRISLSFQEMSIWLLKIHLWILGCVSCNEERSSTKCRQVTHMCLAQEGYLQRKLKELDTSLGKTALGFGY